MDYKRPNNIELRKHLTVVEGVVIALLVPLYWPLIGIH